MAKSPMKKVAKELRKHLKKVYKTPDSWSWANHPARTTIEKFAEFNPIDLSTFDPSKLPPLEREFYEAHEAAHEAMSKAMLRRFILFYGAEYYPSGGWGDFQGSFDTLEEALIDEIPSGNNWWHVIDITTGEQVADSNYGKRGSGTRLIDNEKINHNERKPL